MTSLEQYVCGMFGVNVSDLFTKSRKRKIANARQICIFMRNEFGRQAYASIARYFGKDHVTPIMARRAMEDHYHTEKVYRNLIDEVINAWYGRTIYIDVPEQHLMLVYHDFSPSEALSEGERVLMPLQEDNSTESK